MDISTNLCAVGFVDEALKLAQLEKENKELKEKILSNVPLCPICQKKMFPVNYKGYYDEFSFWQCECWEFTKEQLNKYDGDT